MDPKDIVRQGYDRIGDEYERWSAAEVTDPARERYLGVLLDNLSGGATVLDLGCGSGALLTRYLAERFHVTGVELSSRMVQLAQRNVPSATFICADMAWVTFPPNSFDGACAFYSLTHLPREDLPPLLHKVASWLKSGGLFVASMSSGEDTGSIEDDWVGGVPMYFAGWASAKNEELVENAGLRVLSASEEVVREEGEAVPFLWVVAKKPS
jgi:cyclopropane fatty-acyl-phospholipid synthase-like methyltransferase